MILLNVSNASIIPITISYKVCKYYNQYYYKDPIKHTHNCSTNDSRLLEGFTTLATSRWRSTKCKVLVFPLISKLSSFNSRLFWVLLYPLYRVTGTNTLSYKTISKRLQILPTILSLPI